MRKQLNTDSVAGSAVERPIKTAVEKQFAVLSRLVCCMVVHRCGASLDDSDSKPGGGGLLSDI